MRGFEKKPIAEDLKRPFYSLQGKNGAGADDDDFLA